MSNAILPRLPSNRRFLDPVPVLVVDDDLLQRELISDALGAQGYQVLVATGGSEGLDLFRAHRPAVVISDIHMPGMCGLEFLRRLRDIDPGAAVVLVSGYASLAVAIEAMKAGAVDFLIKPFEMDHLVTAVRAAA